MAPRWVCFGVLLVMVMLARVTWAQGPPVAAHQSGTWIVQPGNTQNTVPWLVSGSVRIQDGKNSTPAVVRPPFQSASAADASLVVALSPNTALPAGSNLLGAVTANAGTNLNTSSLALDASVTAQKVAVTVVALQVTASGDTVLVASGTHKITRSNVFRCCSTASLKNTSALGTTVI